MERWCKWCNLYGKRCKNQQGIEEKRWRESGEKMREKDKRKWEKSGFWEKWLKIQLKSLKTIFGE